MNIRVYCCRIFWEVYIVKEKPKTCLFCGAHDVYFVLAEEWRLLRSENLCNIT